LCHTQVWRFNQQCRWTLRHNLLLEGSSQRSIISSLLPSNVRDRLFPVDQAPPGIEPTKHRLRSFLAGDGKAIDPSLNAGQGNTGSSPIADLFDETTVLFSNIAGFTAWSSVREPT
jgi:hypothetical protein